MNFNISTPKIDFRRVTAMPRFTMPGKFQVGRNNTAQSGAMERQLSAERNMKTYK